MTTVTAPTTDLFKQASQGIKNIEVRYPGTVCSAVGGYQSQHLEVHIGMSPFGSLGFPEDGSVVMFNEQGIAVPCTKGLDFDKVIQAFLERLEIEANANLLPQTTHGLSAVPFLLAVEKLLGSAIPGSLSEGHKSAGDAPFLWYQSGNDGNHSILYDFCVTQQVGTSDRNAPVFENITCLTVKFDAQGIHSAATFEDTGKKDGILNVYAMRPGAVGVVNTFLSRARGYLKPMVNPR